MPHIIRIAMLQMDVSIRQPEVNFSRLQEMLLQAVNEQPRPDILLFPELWNTGYALEEFQQLADINGEKTDRFISEFCQKYQVNIVAGSIADKKQHEVRNTIHVYDRTGGRVGEYSKMHLFRLMDEEKHITSGERVVNLSLDDAPIGLTICYDIRFPELPRKLALNGAKILFVPAQWPKPRLHHWRTLLMARAIENQMYVVACNRVGTSGTTDFFGHSMIIDPWGEILVEGDEAEAILTAEIDLDQVDQVRKKIPIFEDRRPELY